MADSIEVEIDPAAVEREVMHADWLRDALEAFTSEKVAQANSLCAGYETGVFHDSASGQTFGPTAAQYGGSVQDSRKGWVGIVHPANYAAMKDNFENNTLLKVKG